MKIGIISFENKVNNVSSDCDYNSIRTEKTGIRVNNRQTDNITKR